MATFILYNIPITQKTPVSVPKSIKKVLVEAGISDPLAAPNGIMLCMLGHYTPGTYLEWGAVPSSPGTRVMGVYDFTIEPVPPLMCGYAMPSGEETVLTPPMDYSMLSNGTYDMLIVAWNTKELHTPISIADEIESVRCSAIIKDAITLTS